MQVFLTLTEFLWYGAREVLTDDKGYEVSTLPGQLSLLLHIAQVMRIQIVPKLSKLIWIYNRNEEMADSNRL